MDSLIAVINTSEHASIHFSVRLTFPLSPKRHRLTEKYFRPCRRLAIAFGKYSAVAWLHD
jgi:hypothetical protein